MGRPRARGVRIYGPYRRGGRWRVHIVDEADDRGRRQTKYRYFASEAVAEAWIDAARDQAQGRTVSQAMEAWLAHREAQGIMAQTVRTYRIALLSMLGGALGKPMRYLSGRGEELYRRAQRDANGRPYAASTHQFALGRSREMGRWLVKERWLRANPWDAVEAVGRRAVGADKVRLSTDESRQLAAWCYANLASQYAVLTLAYLLLGARASELCRRDVRDLDDGATVLKIGKTKTEAGRRSLQLPAELRSAILSLVAGRSTDAPIFVNELGVRLSRFLARKRVIECCKLAGVTAVPPQALRRTNADLAFEASVAPLAISQHLGHATATPSQVTTRSYAERGAAHEAKAERASRRLRLVP